jgi:ABC-type Na+ efflux pump permease subunit
MQDKKFWTIAKYEFTQTVKKPSFWLSTLFIPIFIAVISFVLGYATVESTKKF